MKNLWYFAYIFMSFLLLVLIGEAYSKVQISSIREICNHYEYKDCNLVLAIAQKESTRNPNSYHKEKSGSYGLMQIQCSTAKDRGLKYSCDQLFSPMINIRFGIKHLEWIESKLSHPTIDNVISVWNAGMEIDYCKYINKLDDNLKPYSYKKCWYKPIRCKHYNKFKWQDFPAVECFKGEYVNQEYWWKVKRYYKHYRGDYNPIR
jgi:hypothetical protein